MKVFLAWGVAVLLAMPVAAQTSSTAAKAAASKTAAKPPCWFGDCMVRPYRRRSHLLGSIARPAISREPK